MSYRENISDNYKPNVPLVEQMRDLDINNTNKNRIYILVLDDDFENALVIKSLLEKEKDKEQNDPDSNIFAFDKPFVALEHFKENSGKGEYCIILYNTTMTHINGLEFIEKVRRTRPESKIVCLTTMKFDTAEISQRFMLSVIR